MRALVSFTLGSFLLVGCNALGGRGGGGNGLGDDDQWSEIDGDLLAELNEAAAFINSNYDEDADPASPESGDSGGQATTSASGGSDGGGDTSPSSDDGGDSYTSGGDSYTTGGDSYTTGGDSYTTGGDSYTTGGDAGDYTSGGETYGGTTSGGGGESTAFIEGEFEPLLSADADPDAASQACLALITESADVDLIKQTAGVFGVTVGSTCIVAAPVIAAPTAELALPAVAVICTGAGGAAALVGAGTSYVAQKIPNLARCSGDLLAQAAASLKSSVSNVRLFSTTNEDDEEGAGTDNPAYPCGIPAEVKKTGPNAACKQMRDAYKAAEENQSSCGNINIVTLAAGDIPAACNEIQTRFGNGNQAADLRKEHGDSCYPQGGKGPMGSADFTHQQAWCQHMRSMWKCLSKATDPKMGCDLSSDMSSFNYPAGCDNLLSPGVCQ